MTKIRNVIFWLHLVAGLIAGVVILIMCVTGALLAFERQTIEWSERDVRYVAVSSEPRLGAAEVLSKVIEAKPDAKTASIAIKNEPGATWEISLGRDGVVFADPYTGAITGESNKKVRQKPCDQVHPEYGVSKSLHLINELLLTLRAEDRGCKPSVRRETN